MADASIVQGLFGVDPTLYQMGQQARQEAQAMEYAQLAPMQQAQYAAFRGGQQLGNVGANLLGIQDPLLQKATMAHQLAGQFDLSKPEGLTQYAQALANAGAPELAVQANAAAQKMRESQATIHAKMKEQLSPVAKAQNDRLRLLQAGYSPNSPEVQELTKYIAAEGSSKTPNISVDEIGRAHV